MEYILDAVGLIGMILILIAAQIIQNKGHYEKARYLLQVAMILLLTTIMLKL